MNLLSSYSSLYLRGGTAVADVSVRNSATESVKDKTNLSPSPGTGLTKMISKNLRVPLLVSKKSLAFTVFSIGMSSFYVVAA